MVLEFILRSVRQLMRYRGRSITAIIGITVMVIIFTIILAFSLQMDALFKQKNLAFTEKFQYLYLGAGFGSEIKNIGYKEMQELLTIDGIDKVLPISSSSKGLPWINLTMGKYQILPVYIQFYNQDYANEFFDGKIMKDVSHESAGIIVSSEFRQNLLEMEDFKRIFGLNQSGSLETMDTSIGKSIKEYQEMDIPIPEELVNLPLVGQEITVRIQNQYLSELVTNPLLESTIPITGEVNPEFLLLGKNIILYPGNQIQKISTESNAKPPNYDTVYVKTKSVDDVLHVVEELEKRGYVPFTDLTNVKNFLKGQQKILWNIFIIMGIISLVALFSFGNTMLSMIQERRAEIAVLKAMGASSRQIVLGFVLEGVLLTFISIGIGFAIVYGFFAVLAYMAKTEVLDPSMFEAFRIDMESFLFLVEPPFHSFLYVGTGMLILGGIMSFIPTLQLFNQNYLSLMKRG